MNSQCGHCPLCMASVTPHLSRVNHHLLPGWWHHPHVTMVVWDSPTQLLLHTDMHEDLHVKCLLFLSNFNQNWSMLTALITFPILNSMKICWEAMQCADWHKGRHGKANRHTFATSIADVLEEKCIPSLPGKCQNCTFSTLQLPYYSLVTNYNLYNLFGTM